MMEIPSQTIPVVLATSRLGWVVPLPGFSLGVHWPALLLCRWGMRFSLSGMAFQDASPTTLGQQLLGNLQESTEL